MPRFRPQDAPEPAGTAATAPVWIADRSATLLLTIMAWVLLLSLTVPWNIFGGIKEATAYQVNPLARLIKLGLLGSGALICLWRAPMTVLLLQQLNRGLVAFLIAVPLSYLWSISPGDTLARFISILSTLFTCLAFCVAGWHQQRFQQVARPFITVILMGSIVFGLVSPDLAIEHGIGTLKDAWHGLTSQKNEFGQLSSFGVVFWMHGWLSGQVKRWQALVFGVMALTCVLLSRSSTSLMATVLVSVFLLLLLRSPPNLRRYMPWIVTGFASMVLTYALAVLKLVPGLDVILEPIAAMTGKDMTFSNRSNIWLIIKEHIALHPWFGTGYGAFWIGPVPSSPSYEFLTRMYFYPTESHNGYLEIINDLGFFGGLILFSYLIIFVKQSLQLMRLDRTQGALFLGLFFQQAIMNLSESCWLTVNSAFLFTLMTMATVALARSLLEARLRQHFRPAKVPIAATARAVQPLRTRPQRR
jgi:O-antigen ligase